MEHINQLMQKIFSISSLVLTIMLYGQLAIAQMAGTLIIEQDSVAMIKQLVKQQLILQLLQNASYKKIEQQKLTTLLKDSAAVDTLSKLVLQQMQQIKNTGIKTGKNIIAGAGSTTKQLLQQQFIKVLQTQQVKSIFSQLTGIRKQPALAWKGGSVSITGQTAPSLLNSGTVFINSSTVSNSWTVFGIPVGLQFTRQDFTGPEYCSRNLFSFQFDREAYLNSLRDKIKLKIKTSDLLPDYNDALLKIKEAAVGRLRTSLDSISGSYKGVLGKQIEELGDPQNLLTGDIGTLQDKLLSADFLQSIESKKNQLAQLQQQLNTGGKINMAQYDSLLQSVQSVAGVHAIIDKIKSFKEEAQKTGLLEKLQQGEQFKTNNMQQWLQEPDKLKTLAKDQLDLNGLQKLFLNMNRLQIGMNNINLSPLTLYQYTNNGVNAEFLNNKTYLFIMAGKQKEFSSLYDNHFTGSSLFSTDNTAMGVRVGRGDLQNSHAHFSLFSYTQNKSSYNNNLISVVSGKTVVFTFSNRLKVNEANYFDLEISKSTHKYDNQKNIYDTLMQGSSLSKQLMGGDDLMQQLAFTLQWNGEVRDRELTYDIHGTRIGKGYNNPGSLFLSRGMTELGGSVKKSFLESKLQLSARGNYREYSYSTNNSKYRNYNFSFQSKWKLKKGQYISLRYQPYQSLKCEDDKNMSIGGSNRLSLDMNIRRRFGKINYQHLISLAALKNDYNFDTVPVNNHSVLISSMQTITINKKSYYLNTQYNRASTASALALFNTQFTCDAGIVYNIGKTIMGSTGVNYNSTKDWFQQTGIKQGFSGQLGEKFTVSFYADILKNIKEYRPNNMGNIRLDWSLQYLLK